jgi:hypothetical protein
VGKREPRPWIVSDELWSLVAPLLPEPGPKLVAGQPAMIQDSAGKHPLYALTKRLEADTASVPPAGDAAQYSVVRAGERFGPQG